MRGCDARLANGRGCALRRQICCSRWRDAPCAEMALSLLRWCCGEQLDSTPFLGSALLPPAVAEHCGL